MNKCFLYSIIDYLNLGLNFIGYKIQMLANKNIVKEKATNDIILSNGYLISRKGNVYQVRRDQLFVELRKGSSDCFVFQQIFIEEEYKTIVDYCIKNKITINNVLDLGANIGLSTIYFKQKFPKAKICSVEPFEPNVNAIEKNFALNKVTASIIKGAVWYKPAMLGFSQDFRGGQEWAIFMNDDVPNRNIKAYTIKELMELSNFDGIDLLKIDVEGSERMIFDKNLSDLSFLNKTKIIAIEIHDEFNCRNDIYEILKKENFDILNSGELTIGFKRNI